jgi:hypothetical protein
MARIVVEADDRRSVLLDERSVKPEHVGDPHAALQLMERVIWAVRDEEQKRAPRRQRGRERATDAARARSALGRARARSPL